MNDAFLLPLLPAPNINVSLGDEPETSPPSLAPLKIPQTWWVPGHPGVGSPELTRTGWGGPPASPLANSDGGSSVWWTLVEKLEGQSSARLGGGLCTARTHASSSRPHPAAGHPSPAAWSRAGGHRPRPTGDMVPVPLPGDILQPPGRRADGERPRWASSSKRLRRCREVKVEPGCCGHRAEPGLRVAGARCAPSGGCHQPGRASPCDGAGLGMGHHRAVGDAVGWGARGNPPPARPR